MFSANRKHLRTKKPEQRFRRPQGSVGRILKRFSGDMNVALELARAGRDFYRRGWVLGTSGNFSAIESREPLRIAITPSGVSKGALRAEDFLIVDEAARVEAGKGRPSAETALHLTIYAARPGAGAVLHTHSVWATLLSERHGSEGRFVIQGYEMLKGLQGVSTHAHAEPVPVLPNSQDYTALSRALRSTLAEYPGAHGFLLRRHGLYTWGVDTAEARRHVEIFEFLFEVLGRSA
jgi:methylthioribulose-1-phosphate dehydratase